MAYQTLGILGGLGPLASVYFTDLLVGGTEAESDQDHIPFFLYNDVFIPDRSAYLLGRSNESPLPALISGVKTLASLGCDLLVVTCNTAHAFYDEMAAATKVPILNIIENALDAAVSRGGTTVGILATDGTVQAGVYHRAAERRGLRCLSPESETQARMMKLIYDVKVGKEVDCREITSAARELKQAGCDAVILGCTELSVVARQESLLTENGFLVDAMTELARACVTLCGKRWKEATSSWAVK